MNGTYHVIFIRRKQTHKAMGTKIL